MASNIFRSKVGDTKPVIDILEEKVGGVWQPIDLTGASVVFKLDCDGVRIASGPATIASPATGGRVSYGWAQGGNGSAGYFERSWTITRANGVVETVPAEGGFPVHFDRDND